MSFFVREHKTHRQHDRMVTIGVGRKRRGHVEGTIFRVQA